MRGRVDLWKGLEVDDKGGIDDSAVVGITEG